MKVLLALAVLATTASAYSASRDIYDIMYLPSTGTKFGFSTLEYANLISEPEAGDDSELSGFVLAQTIGYSMNDRLSLAGSMNYTNLEFDTKNNENTRSGFSDPTASARYRLVDEDFRFDLVGGLLLSFIDSEIESDGDQDNLQGGPALFVGAQMGNKTESFQWAILTQLTHNLERNIERSPGKDLDVDANDELLVRGDFLNKFNAKSYLRSFASIELATILESNDDTYAAPSTQYTVGTEYQHLLSADMLLRAGIDYTVLSQNTGVIDKTSGTIFRFGANYQF